MPKPKPTIDRLVPDIYEKVLNPSVIPDLKEEDVAQFGVEMARKLVYSLQRERGKRKDKTIFASEVGKPCMRQTWYGYHMPDKGEPLTSKMVLKFLYGDILEEVLLFLARAAGHHVKDEQKVVEIPLEGGWKIRGRTDATIDGKTVDVKSTSPFGFKEMVNNPKFDDKFGYRKQLSVYHWARIRNGDVALLDEDAAEMHLFMVDKQNGDLGLNTMKYEEVIGPAIALSKALENSEEPPARPFVAEPTTHGNEKLGTQCSYCSYKQECWKDANDGKGLRAFAYAKGPVFMTKVNKVPDKVPELTLRPTKEAP